MAKIKEEVEAQNILEKANELTGGSGDRTKAYGSAAHEANVMTALIKALFDVVITPEQWYIIMKIRRETNKHQRDNLVDIAGYARVIEILFAEQGEPGYVNR